MMTILTLLTVWLAGLTSFEVSAAGYGRNHVPVRRDNESVAANFPDVDGVTLNAPAFLNLDSISSGFSNGSAGPTDDATMSTFFLSKRLICLLTYEQATSFKAYLHATNG